MTRAKTLLTSAAALIAVAGAALAASAPPPPPTNDPWSPPTAMTTNGKYVMREGQAIYRNVCANCHMQDAKGAEGAGIYPALADNPKLAAPAYPVMVVVHGQKGMPHFGDTLDDGQVAAVVSYIRTNFGNRFAEPVTAADVKAVR